MLLLPFIGFVIITDMNNKSVFWAGRGGILLFPVTIFLYIAGYIGVWIDTSYPG
jgi:hypothetical protein